MVFDKYIKENLILEVVFLSLAFAILIKSPDFPAWPGDVLTDSSVFQTIAMMMENGYMPYRDSFDHKGPVLYLINYLGRMINHDHGIFWVECVNLYILVKFLYKIADLFAKNIVSSVLTICLSVYMVSWSFQGGNFTEEYAATAISIGLYVYLDYLLNLNISRLRLVVCGAMFSLVLLLRPNMIAVWFVFSLSIAIFCVWRRQYQLLFGFSLWFFAGVGLILLPILVWLTSCGIVHDWFDCYIKFNLNYIEHSDVSRGLAFMVFGCHPVFILASLSTICMLFCKKQYRWILTTYGVCLVLSLLLVTLSGRLYAHYAMTVVPLTAAPIAMLFRQWADIERSIYDYCSRFLIKNIISFLCIILFVLNFMSIYQLIAYQICENTSQSEKTREICEVIQRFASPQNTISVFGNTNKFYVRASRLHATRYSYQYPIGAVLPEIMDDYYKSLKNELPAVIVVDNILKNDMDWSLYWNKIITFLNKNNYRLVYGKNNDRFVVYAREKHVSDG